MPKIVSTLTGGQRYDLFKQDGDGKWRPYKSINVKGGANVADKYALTPNSVVTEITQEEADMLLGKNGHAGHPDFKNHVRNGFIKITDYNTKADDLEAKDKSAPLTPDQYADTPEEVGKKGKRATTTKPKVEKD